MRGCSTASCGSMPKSTMLSRACGIAFAGTSPPGVPKGSTNCPGATAMAGLGVRRGRLPGASRLGWPSDVQDCEPRDDGTRPVPGITGESDETSLGVADTVLPQRSTTQM